MIAELQSVEAGLQYAAQAEISYRVGEQTSDFPSKANWHVVPIFDARPIAETLSLDREGFVLMKSPSAVTDFYDAAAVRTVYYHEVEALIRRATGATRTVTFAHDVRNRERSGRGGIREPVPMIHNDYTPESGPQMVRESMPADEAEHLLRRRFAEFNVWRPIRPVRSTPLAVCDAQSIAVEDLVRVNLKHEVYLLSYQPNHRWYYFPLMQTDELLVLKCFDSAPDGRARFTAHSAFEDPTAAPDAPARESIEVRVLAFFDEA